MVRIFKLSKYSIYTCYTKCMANFCSNIISTNNFINIILHELEKINPNAFQCAFLGEWKKEEEQNLLEIKSQLLTLSTAITNIQDNKVSVYSIDQVEVDLYRQTENPS